MADLNKLVQDALDKEGVGSLGEVARAIWQQESGGSSAGNVRGVPVASHGGNMARSPFQIMPATARAYGFTGSDAELENPEVAAPIMAKKLAADYKKYGNIPDTVAAYYQGDNRKDSAGNYSGKADNGPTTQEYVQQVLARAGQGANVASFVPQELQNQVSDEDIHKNFEERHAALTDSLKVNPEFESLLTEIANQIQGQQAPAPEAVPARTSTVGRAIAGFAGGMNAVQTGSGQLAQNLQNIITSKDNAAADTEQRNYARTQAFDEKKRDMLLDLKMKALEMRRDQAVKAGDAEKALKLAEAELKLGELIKKGDEERKNKADAEADARDQARELARVKEQNEGRLSAIDRRAQVKQIESDYGVPKEIAQKMHDTRVAIQQAFVTQMQALGTLAQLPDEKATMLRQQLRDELMQSDKQIYEEWANSPAGKAAESAQLPAPAIAPPAAQAPAAVDSTSEGAPADTSLARPQEKRGRLGL